MQNQWYLLGITFLCALLHYKLPAAAAEQNSTDFQSKLMAALMTRVWAQAHQTRNFLIAPQEALELYENLYIGTQGASTENEIEATYTAHPIVVSNTLSGTHFEHVVALAQRLKHAQLLRQPRTSVQSAEFADVELINRVTMNARWTQNFQKRDTHKHLFYHTPYEHVYTDFMSKDDIFRYAELPALHASALELRLQRNGIGMLFLRPHAADGLAALEQQIISNLSVIDEIVRWRLQPTVVRAVIPKFKVTRTVQLSDIFSELQNSLHNVGIVTEVAVNPIGLVMQQCQLEVSEQGIGELDNSTVLFWNTYSSLRVAPINFELNQPFLFIIRNPQGIQFVGHVVAL